MLWINQGWANPVLDGLFVWLSSRPGFALPFALGLLALFTWRWRKAGLYLWLLLLLVVGTGDFIGAQLKDVLAQPRPCYSLAEQVRQLDRAPGVACGANLSGMPSNHALNAFATAAFLTVVLGRRAALLFLVAALVYLAKHFPSQIATGALIGTIWGLTAAWLGLNYLPFLQRIRARRAAGTSPHEPD